MQTITTLGWTALLFTLTLCSANKNIYSLKFNQNDPFEIEWKRVDSLDSKRLPKQALTLVEEILEAARAKEDADQILKAFLYRAKYTQELNEEGTDRA
ncbi:MAG: hypothetical protein HKN16_08330, partial [Saprospiraceae bacterium]|nr:hypothetical protein [Saprospiraceae bacterium]